MSNESGQLLPLRAIKKDVRQCSVLLNVNIKTLKWNFHHIWKSQKISKVKTLLFVYKFSINVKTEKYQFLRNLCKYEKALFRLEKTKLGLFESYQ